MSQYVVLILLPAFLISMYAQYKVKSNFERYGRVRSAHGYTGQEVAGRLLRSEGINNVKIAAVPGKLSDHYDPVHKRVNLSEMVYAQNSIAAVSVAAHECGHAMQHNEEYGPLTLRHRLVPITNFVSSASMPILVLGFMMNSLQLIWLGVILFSGVVLFHVVTLPVEFNASHRAIVKLESSGILSAEEIPMAKKVLGAAALTYVAAALSAVANLLYYIAIFSGRDR